MKNAAKRKYKKRYCGMHKRMTLHIWFYSANTFVCEQCTYERAFYDQENAW
jgi:hypothetical protein